MAELEVLRNMVKSFRLLELRSLMLFAGKSKLGRKSELQARAEELIAGNDDKIAKKIRELSGEMYKGATETETHAAGIEKNKTTDPLAQPADKSLAGAGSSTGNTTEAEDETPLAKKSKKAKPVDKGSLKNSSKKKKKEKKKKKDKKKKSSSPSKKKTDAVSRFDPKPKGGKNKTAAAAPAPPTQPPPSGRSRRAAAIAAASALQSWAGGGRTGDGGGDNHDSDDEDINSSDESSSEEESSGEATETESEVDEVADQPESTRPKKKGGKAAPPASKTQQNNSAATNNGLSALSAMVPQATQGSMLPLPPPGERLDPSRLAAAYSHLMGRGSFAMPTGTAVATNTAAAAAAAAPAPPSRPNYCGFTYRTVPQIPKSPAASTSSNYIPPAERSAYGGQQPTYIGGSHHTSSYSNKSHLIYPTCPDVRLKRLPFYDVMATLLKPSSLQPTGSARFQEQTFSFHLTPQQVSAIEQSGYRDAMGRPDYKKQIQVRFSLLETSCEQADNFPSSVCVKVNGRLQPLPNPIPTNKPGVEPKRPPKAINVTGLCKLSSTVANYINVSWTVEVGKGFTLSVYFVERLNSTELLGKLKTKGQRNPDYTRAVIKDKLNDTDNEIATTSCKVSLACPLGKMRMRLPCRSSQCDHLQCFDAANYLMMNEKKDKWQCPVCNQTAPFDTLMLDGYFTEILESRRLPDDEHEIVLQADASWDPLPPKIPDHLNPKNFDQAPGAPIPKVEPKKEEKNTDVETLSDDDTAPPPASTASSSNGTKNSKKPTAPVECVVLDSDDEDDTPAANVAAVAAAEAAAGKRGAASSADEADEVRRPPSKRRKTSSAPRVIFDDEDDEEDVSDGSDGGKTTSEGEGTTSSTTPEAVELTDVNAAHEALVALAAAAAAKESHDKVNPTLLGQIASRAAAASADAGPELICLDDDDD